LFTKPWWRSTSSTITAKNRHQLCGSDDVDEDHRDVAFFAAEFRALLFGGSSDFTADVSAEQVAHLFSFAQTRDHRVETPL
jgi:hypothetical protein